MKLHDVARVLEGIAPLRYAEPWDNVGLLAGDEDAPATRALLCIDLTAAVLDEALGAGCDLVVAYHPPIFDGLKRIDGKSVLARALRAGVALYSPHTALDAVSGGTNEMLADAVGMRDRQPIREHASKDEVVKLVTFIPESAVDTVARALFDAGAGVIGEYTQCSFRAPGTGTFFGREGAQPVVGERGRLELAPEVRLETRVPTARVGAVVRALREAHPYEEPAFDLVRIASVTGDMGGVWSPGVVGMGRIGVVEPQTREELVARVKAYLGVDGLLLAGARPGAMTGMVTRVAVAAGSAGELLGRAIARGAEVVVTGEVRHHDALRAEAAGVTVLCALHSNSERRALVSLRERLRASLPTLDVVLSEADRDPFRWV